MGLEDNAHIPFHQGMGVLGVCWVCVGGVLGVYWGCVGCILGVVACACLCHVCMCLSGVHGVECGHLSPLGVVCDIITCAHHHTQAHDKVCIGAAWHPLESSKVATCSWDGLIKYWE